MKKRMGSPVMRQVPPELMASFEPRLVVPHVRDIQPGCRCTWVPRPAGFGLPPVRTDRPADDRQPWLTNGLAMKFRDSCCPVSHRPG